MYVLTNYCAAEALNAPFMLLPFRPDTDPSSARSFIRNFYKQNAEGSYQYRGPSLAQELRLTEAVVLGSILKWCWSRMPGGVVTWPVYDGFKTGEKESQMARNAFDTFIPIGAGSEARTNIIFDFFDLMAAVAAHGKSNGHGGRKLSRLAGWWAFEHSDDGKGFEGGYKSWSTAADASSHLFFAYLRSLSPDTDPSLTVIERIPRSLQALLASTEYPPETPTLLQRSTPRVLMLVDSVSPTPFALLRRAKHFEYRDSDRVLRAYSEFEDPVDALTDECKRVLYAISTINSAAAISRHGNANKTGQESWSAFQNLGFSDLDQSSLAQKPVNGMNGSTSPGQGLRSAPRSRNDAGRPTTPSWADFLSSGFVDDEDARTPTTLSLPHDKVLPPLGSRAQTPLGQSIGDDHLAPGEMAAIASVELDDAFWWVWMTSLSGEEPSDRKAVFGRCALIETTVMHGRWLIMEEQVKGASPDPTEGVYIAPKKSSIFSFTKRGRNKAKNEKPTPQPKHQLERVTSATPSKSSLAPDQATRIKEAAAVLARKQTDPRSDSNQRRGRYDDAASTKTSSMLTMGMMTEASPAMKWANAYDKNAIRAQYLGDNFAGRGASKEDLLSKRSSVNLMSDGASSIGPHAPALTQDTKVFPSDDPQNRDLPALPKEEQPAVIDQEPPPVMLEPTQPTPAAEEITPEVPQERAATPPKAPDVNVVPVEEEHVRVQAEEVPLPETTQAEPADFIEKEVAVDTPQASTAKVGRKPVPRSSNINEHPAFRQQTADQAPEQPVAAPARNAEPQSPQSPKSAAAIAAQRAMQAKATSTSPESDKHSQGKLKKQSGGGGLKKLFGRKKDNPNRQSLDVGAKTNGSLAPPSESNLGRRLSLMRKKPSPKVTPAASQPAIASPVSATNDEPVMPESHGHYERSTADVSHVESQSDADAVHEFSRFDQGPMEDMPAATPQELPTPDPEEYEGLHQPAPQRHYNTQLANRIAPERHETDDGAFATPMELPANPVDDAQSEASMDERREDPEQFQDRWAKIRENAAKRAARASEEHSMQSRPSQSMRETDDGETSGEESRFAGHL